MKDLPEAVVDSKLLQQNFDESVDKETTSNSEHKNLPDTSAKVSLFSSFFTSNFSLFERNPSSFSVESNPSNSSAYSWTTAVKNIISSGSMRRLQDRVLGSSSAVSLSSTSDIWFLGKCYNLSFKESHNPDLGNNFTSFLEDFSSRIWITYRKGFEPIGDSKFTCDVNWGCMIRSSQMLIAQTLILHYLGRSWRKPSQKPYDSQYIEILRLFGDSSLCTFSIHNLLKAGKDFGLAAGSWLGPYAMCRTWETIAHAHREQDEHGEHKQSLPMVLYVVSGDKDGEQGGAPVICIEVVSRFCHDFDKEQLDWAPILFLVPLVLGLEKINPRYIPLLRETFTFPQSLGILGGKSGASTYIVGVQDEKALYLDPHEVQTAVDIKKDDLESDCSSYHCRTVRHLSLDMIDPSLAIGFYCRDKGDFEDFCSRATQLADKSGGAPLFTVAQNLPPSKPISHNDCSALGAAINSSDDFCSENLNNDQTQEDEWQIL